MVHSLLGEMEAFEWVGGSPRSVVPFIMLAIVLLGRDLAIRRKPRSGDARDGEIDRNGVDRLGEVDLEALLQLQVLAGGPLGDV